MPFECPPGFRLYADVLTRLGDVRPCGAGVKFRCLFPDRHKNGDRNWSGYARIGTNGGLIARCNGCGAGWPEIKAEVGLPGGAWFPHKGRLFDKDGRATTSRRSKPMLTATYDYRDQDGVLLYQKLRYETFEDGKRTSKTFKQRRPLARCHWKHLGIPDTAAEVWVWGMAANEYGRKYVDGQWDLTIKSDEHQAWLRLETCCHVLYRLPGLLAANEDHPVFLVEGEKDADRLRSMGFVATCTDSTSAVPDPQWFAPLGGRRVVVVADNDFTGHQHAMRQAGILVCGGARSVRVVWPGYAGYDVGPGGDISDWLDGGKTKADLIQLCKAFPEYRIW